MRRRTSKQNITKTCPRCKGLGKDPLNILRPCRFCRGRKLIHSATTYDSSIASILDKAVAEEGK